jgi:hypothetical protein
MHISWLITMKEFEGGASGWRRRRHDHAAAHDQTHRAELFSRLLDRVDDGEAS